jgi:low temperature requirement protein LtrA
MENIEKERHTSWLENCYDLIVAIVVFQLSSILNHDVSISGFPVIYCAIYTCSVVMDGSYFL